MGLEVPRKRGLGAETFRNVKTQKGHQVHPAACWRSELDAAVQKATCDVSVEGWLGASGVLVSCRAEKDVASCGGRGMP